MDAGTDTRSPVAPFRQTAGEVKPVESTWPCRPYVARVVRQESLPFRVRLASDDNDLRGAVRVRAAAFTRHVPQIGQSLTASEEEDAKPDVLVLIAERKLDGAVLGSMRLQPNFFRPLRVEGETSLPAPYRGARLVETTRLGVESGRAGLMVMFSIIKAAYEICHACDVEFGIALGRSSMMPILLGMQYDDIYGRAIPISYGQGVPHWIFAIPIGEVESRLRARGHAMYAFMATTEHPDISIDWSKVRQAFFR